MHGPINVKKKKDIFFIFVYGTVYTMDDEQYSCISYKRKFNGNHFSRSGYVRNDLASDSLLHP